ncbi:MAG: hypothetical protein CMK09_16875 [Ponticaulis sp.]|nr:hypothetical protein [Ponticaulis sp.]|tara:strand:- start:36043 stop:36561 length:519 start_codon:yes stop_codon:yes gene_type:complete
MKHVALVMSVLLLASPVQAESGATSDFPQSGSWSCEETSKISGYDAIVRSSVTYPEPGKFHSKGVATLYLNKTREVRVSLDGRGEFTVDGDSLTSTYDSVVGKPLPSYGFSKSEADFLADWQAYLIRGFTSIEGRALDQTWVRYSDNAFDLVAKIGGRDSVVSCQRAEELVG